MRDDSKPDALSAPIVTPREQVLALVQVVAHAHKLTLAELLMPDVEPGARFRKRTEARHAAMYEVSLAFPAMSTTQIGRLFNRHHTAVLNARRRHLRRLAAMKARA